MRCEAVRRRLLGASLFKAGHGRESLFASRDELLGKLALVSFFLGESRYEPYASSGTRSSGTSRGLRLRG
jgi:hypothetical protein